MSGVTAAPPAPMPGRRLAVCLTASLMILAAATLAPAGASAAPKATVDAFGGEGSGDGQFLGRAGIAINQTSGDVYVVDAGNDRVQRFDEDGVYISQWGTNGSGDGEFTFDFNPAGIAVAPDGTVYVADTANNRIQVFAADGTYQSQFGTAGSGDGEFFAPISVAVDPSDGDVLVADRDNNRVQRFTSAGVYESQFSGVDDNAFFSPHRVAVDSTGAIYVFEQYFRVQKFDSAGAFIDVLGADVLFNSPSDLAVDAGSDHVFVAQVNDSFDGGEVVEFDAAGVLVERHLQPRVESAGSAVRSSTGNIYVAGNFLLTEDDPTPESVYILGEFVPPTVTLAPATDVEGHSATLNGVVNPNGARTGYFFEISTNGVTWTSVPATDVDIGRGTDPVAVSQAATGLAANTQYRVRLVARPKFNPDAATTTPEQTFLTDAVAPVAETLASSHRLTTSVRLQGRVNPNGSPTTYRFEYGKTSAYGFTAPIPSGSAGAGIDDTVVTELVTGLEPDTTYHYRVVATSAQGTDAGADRTFTTRAAAATPPGRGIELVSPAHKIAGVGVGAWYDGPGQIGFIGVAAHERERFVAAGGLGSVLVDGAYAYAADWALAQRTPQGWASSPATSRAAHGSQNFASMVLAAATEDLTLTSYTSNGHVLKLFPEMEPWEGGNIGEVMIVRDWTSGRWELFGPLDPAQAISAGSPIGSTTKEFAADGSAMVSHSRNVRGLAGPGDPTNPAFPDLQTGGSVYLDEVTGAFSDAFPGDDGERELVNVCTGDGAARTVVPSVDGSGKLEGLACPAALPDRDARLISPRGASIDAPQAVGFSQGEDAEGAVSADGARAVFMSPDPHAAGGGAPCEGTGVDSECPTQLFVRQRGVDGGVVTRWISRSEVADQDASLLAPALFEGASRDGDKVFFRTASPLTADDPSGSCAAPCTAGAPETVELENGAIVPFSMDLYMYDLPDGPDGDPATADADPAGGDLVRISAGPGGDGDCNSGLAGTALRFVSADGSRAYFTCAAPLPGVPAPADGTITTPGGSVDDDAASNLYAYDTTRPVALRWRFIARLPRTSDLGRCATVAGARGSAIGGAAGGDVVVTSTLNCVRGSADGSLLTFFTDGQLTADDPDAVSGDVYAYDAARDELTRVSAPQGGVGGTYPCATEGSDSPCYGDPGIEGSTGSTALHRLGVATRPDGTHLAFFESRSRLVPEDTDQAYDVYQWGDGKLTLLSTADGGDPDGVFYAGNDRSGLNVYLATRGRLTWQDKDAVLDVYTARIGGGIPEPPLPSVCAALADACQGVGTGVSTLVQPNTTSSAGDGTVVSGARPVVSLRKPSASQRRKAARSGILRLRVRTNAAGMLSLSARAKLGKRVKRVARASKRVRKAGATTVKLRLNRGARARLRSGRALRVTLRVAQSGARTRTLTVRLPGVRS